MKISECGIFEVASGKYSKTYRFSDVNYATRTENEQESFFQRIIANVSIRLIVHLRLRSITRIKTWSC